MEHWDEGIYAFRGKGMQDATPLILSAGVHGDETGPVRVLDAILAALKSRALIPQRPCLIITANMQALLNGKRFMQWNLNRLFGAPMRPPGYEGKRVQALENACRDFAELYGIGWHLDLHSTIKRSHHPHFALMPACQRHYDDSWSPLLAAHGFSALVRQRSASHTFSHFTAAQLGFESFTLECGSVQGGDDDVANVLDPLLHRLLVESPFDDIGDHGLQRYQVIADIVKRHHHFRFLIDEQCDNFSPIASGTVLAQDGDQAISVPADHCALLFVNSQVPVGDRAGLLVQRC